jgi:hypothetical protein
MSRGSTIRLAASAVVTALVLCGCGSDGDGTASTKDAGAAATTTTTTKSSAKTTKAKIPARAPRRKYRRFHGVQEGLDFIAKGVDVPVVAPTDVPHGGKVLDATVDAGHGFLTLLFPHGRILTIQYGEAGFDGCGPRHPKVVKVGTNPAVIDSTKVKTGGKLDGRTYTTLVWPATLKDLQGRYGLSGTFTAKEMLAFAESMEKARAAKPRGPKNC